MAVMTHLKASKRTYMSTIIGNAVHKPLYHKESRARGAAMRSYHGNK